MPGKLPQNGSRANESEAQRASRDCIIPANDPWRNCERLYLVLPAQAEMLRFARLGLGDAIRNAALCRLPNGKRHPHQRRLSKAVLEESERRLQRRARSLRHAPDFSALHRIVESEIGSISGIGPLTIYDVAHRVGACLGKAPELVYLHAGTNKGAAVFGLSGKAIHTDKLPIAFSRLSAAECEDCLCIYKDQLRGGLAKGHSKCKPIVLTRILQAGQAINYARKQPRQAGGCW
jgi:hypothetical protein